MYKKISMLTAALFCSAALLAQNTTLNVKLDTPFAKKLNSAYSKNDKTQIEALKATEDYKEYIKV